jgi:hypothetical protein
MVGGKIVQKTNVREWVTNGVHYEDADNQQSKDLISEASSKADDTSQVKESGKYTVKEHPGTDPGVESEERNINGLGHVVNYSRKGQHWSSGSHDALRIGKARLEPWSEMVMRSAITRMKQLDKHKHH